MYNKSYPIVPNSIDFDQLLDQLEAEATIPDPTAIAFSKTGDQITLSFTGDLSIDQVTTLDAIIAAQDTSILLEALKIQRRKEIDARTAEIVAEGFEFNDIMFSGSVESQARIMGVYNAGANAPFPIRFMSKDDTTYIDIPDVATMTAFYFTGLVTLKAKVDTGTSLKVALISASTIAEVDAIVDNR